MFVTDLRCRFVGLTVVCVAALGQTGCSAENTVASDEGVAVSQVRIGSAGATGSFVGMQVLATDAKGLAFQCDSSAMDVDIEVSFDGGPFTAVDSSAVEVVCSGEQPDTIGLVLDNSGSQHRVLEQTQVGAAGLLGSVFERSGSAAMVRVSTGATTLTELSADMEPLTDALDGMFVNRGWTALYDGVRLAHELVAPSFVADYEDTNDSLEQFCSTTRRPALVAFSNGVDNNSANQASDLGNDGIDTMLADLHNLKIKGVTTPFFSIGLGKDVDHDLLAELAAHTGGKHLTVQEAEDLPAAFDLVADYGPQSLQVCAPLDDVGCGSAVVRVSYTYNVPDGSTFSETIEHAVDVPCPEVDPRGRSALVMLTLSNPGVPGDLADTLAHNAVAYTSPVAQPRVAVVADDNHHGEFAGDPAFIRDLLVARGHDAVLLNEPAQGLGTTDLDGFDVVWLANPGWPVDDEATMGAIEAHLAGGGGAVLSGDDMSWAYGHGFSMARWTHLEHLNNGTKTCGKSTDNNAGHSFRVSIDDATHPLIADLEGREFLYGDDIDHSSPLSEGEEVLAWARLDGVKKCDVVVPVVVAYDPE